MDTLEIQNVVEMDALVKNIFWGFSRLIIYQRRKSSRTYGLWLSTAVRVTFQDFIGWRSSVVLVVSIFSTLSADPRERTTSSSIFFKIKDPTLCNTMLSDYKNLIVMRVDILYYFSDLCDHEDGHYYRLWIVCALSNSKIVLLLIFSWSSLY